MSLYIIEVKAHVQMVSFLLTTCVDTRELLFGKLSLIIFYTDPVFLQRLISLLSSDVMSDDLVDRGLVALKDEWMK